MAIFFSAVIVAVSLFAVTTTIASPSPVDIVAHLTPLVNWPAVQFSELHSAANQASVTSANVRDEVDSILSQIRRSSMQLVCNHLAETAKDLDKNTLVQRTLALSSLLALFSRTSLNSLDPLRRSAKFHRHLLKDKLALVNTSFIDQLLLVFMKDVGRLLHRILLSHQGLGSNEKDVVGFLYGHYLASPKSVNMISQYMDMKKPSKETQNQSQVTGALKSLYKLIPFPKQLNLVATKKAAEIQSVKFPGATVPRLPVIEWQEIDSAFNDCLKTYKLFSNEPSEKISVKKAVATDQKPAQQGIVSTGHEHAQQGIVYPGLVEASFKMRPIKDKLTHCIAVRICIALLHIFSSFQAYSSLDLDMLKTQARKRHFQEMYELFLGQEVSVSVLHKLLRCIDQHVEGFLINAVQLNKALFLPSSALVWSELVTQNQTKSQSSVSITDHVLLRKHVLDIDTTFSKFQDEETDPGVMASPFCRDFLEIAFRQADNINPLDPKATLLDYQRSILSRCQPSNSSPTSDQAAIIADFISDRALDLVFSSDDSIRTLVLQRLQPLNSDKECVLLRLLDADDSVLRSLVIHQRLRQLRPTSESAIVKKKVDDLIKALGLDSAASSQRTSSSSSSSSSSLSTVSASYSPVSAAVDSYPDESQSTHFEQQPPASNYQPIVSFPPSPPFPIMLTPFHSPMMPGYDGYTNPYLSPAEMSMLGNSHISLPVLPMPPHFLPTSSPHIAFPLMQPPSHPDHQLSASAPLFQPISAPHQDSIFASMPHMSSHSSFPPMSTSPPRFPSTMHSQSNHQAPSSPTRFASTPHMRSHHQSHSPPSRFPSAMPAQPPTQSNSPSSAQPYFRIQPDARPGYQSIRRNSRYAKPTASSSSSSGRLATYVQRT